MEWRESIRGESDLIAERFESLATIEDKQGNAFPPRFKRSATPGELQSDYAYLDDDTWSGDTHSTAGRIKLKRDLGQIAFIDIEYDGETVQLYFQADELDDYNLIDEYDLGDYVGVEGEMMKTQTGEISVDVKEHRMLSKSLRPLPDKYHGVKDTEIRYRKRYLDLMMNEEPRKTLRQRTEIVQYVRNHLRQRDFLEVDTPVLHNMYGGAAAKPFKTYHNDLNQEVYLRVSPELYLKKLLIGGYTKVFEISKCFRNESIDATHNPEFTQMEVYQAFADYEDMMDLTEEVFAGAAKHIHGTTEVEYDGDLIDFAPPWPRVTMLDSINDIVDIDAGTMSEDELASFCHENGYELDKKPCWGNYVQLIFEEECEETYTQPTFITDHPQSTIPLCKQTEYDDRLIERFEPICAGMEIANAYSELNDPVKQRELLVDQAEQRAAGDDEAHPLDEDFLEAMEHGMPPAGGLGIGLDRMAMLLLNQQSIKDVILFPAMKDKEATNE